MLPSNLPIVREMLASRPYREFLFELDDVFRSDPNYTPRRGRRILESAARGERIIRFEDRWVVSSFVPPVPSPAFKQFVCGGVDPERLYSDLAYARRSAPLSVHLCITMRCPYRCEHCGATYVDGRDELTGRQWVDVIGQLQDLGVANIVFSGGEPLVRSDIEEIIASIDQRSSTLLFTNGCQLTLERAHRLKEAGLFILAVSLDSPHPEEHNRIRRNKQAFSHAIDAIRNASRAGLYTLISSVVYRRNLTQANLHKLFELGKEHGAHEVRIHQPIPRGELSDPAEAAEIFHTKEDIARLNRIQFAVNRSTQNGMPKVSSFPYTEGPCKFGCGAGVLHSYITATGDLWPCDFIPCRFGNVVEQDVKSVYGRMMAVSGVPKNFCMARKLAGAFQGKSLPLELEESCQLCQGCHSRSYPRFFKDLQKP